MALPDVLDVLRLVGQHLAFVRDDDARMCLLTTCETPLAAPTSGWRQRVFVGHPRLQSLLLVLAGLTDLDAFACTCRDSYRLAWTVMAPLPGVALLLCRFGFAAAFLVAPRDAAFAAAGAAGPLWLWLSLLSRSEPTFAVALAATPQEDLDVADCRGETALFKACTLGLRAQAVALLQARASPAGAGGGLTALNTACRRCDPVLVAALLSARADPRVLEYTEEEGALICSCLDATVSWKYELTRGSVDARRLDRLEERCALLRRLLTARASVEGACWRGVSAAHTAARTDPSASLLRLLLEAEASPDARDDTGETPLHAAALYGHGHCVRALLDARADAATTDLEGRTARDVVLRLQWGCRGSESDRELAQRLLCRCLPSTSSSSSSEAVASDDSTSI